MKRVICLLLTCLFLSGCAGQKQPDTPELKQYTATFLGVFDTVTRVTGKAESEESFREKSQIVHDELEKYHQLFDIYNDYEGITNLKTVNDNAGIAPVAVDRIILDLLLDCRDYYARTGGMVNVAMGSVLRLWHEARNDGLNDPLHAYLPKLEALQEAAKHTSWESIVIDEEASTVFITDSKVQLDVGAIAKGWATQRICEIAPSGLLISVGGNVASTGPKDAEGTPWVVGIQDPDNGENYLHTLYMTSGSMVTSGDYQRNYAVDGKLYHHIIHPDTLFPSEYWRSVTILCEDSGLADALSTSLFLLPLEEGLALLGDCDAEAMWVDKDGNFFYSPGFESHIRT